MKTKILLAAVAMFLFIFPLFFAALPWNYSFRANAQQVNGFQIINSLWGTASSPVSAAPGDRGVPLTVTLRYLFPNTAESVRGVLELPAAFSYYGSSTAFAIVTGLEPTGAVFQMTFKAVNLASNLTLGSYVLPLSISWTAAGYSYVLNQTTSLTIRVDGRPQLYFSSGGSSLIPGEVNNVPLVIYNGGSGLASNIFISASSQAAGILNTLPEIQSVGSGSKAMSNLEIYVPISSAGVVVPLSISSTCKDPYGDSVTSSQTFNMYVSAVSPTGIQFETPVQTLTPGLVNNISITIQNIGSVGLSQISTSISTQSQISILSTIPYVQSLSPNSSLSYIVRLYVASTLTNAPVSITLTSSFVGQNGVSGTSSQTIGFYTSNLSATITPILSATITPILSATITGLVAQPGTTANYRITVDDPTNRSIGIALNVQTPSGYDWNLTSPLGQSVSSVSLGPAQIMTLTLSVNVPVAAQAGIANLLVQAHSGQLNQTLPLTIDVKAVAPLAVLSYTTPNFLVTGNVGKTLPYDVTFVNSGNVPIDNLSLTIGNVLPSFNITIIPQIISSLPPGKTATFIVGIVVPPNANTGDYYLTLQPHATNVNLGARLLRVSITQSTSFTYIGIALLIVVVAVLFLAYRRYGRR